MPQTGPPRQLKKIAFLEGDWDVIMKVKPSSQSAWVETQGRSNFQFVLDGAVLQQIYEGVMSGHTFRGIGYIAFNRFTGKWQHVWSDNVAAVISIYEGEFNEGRLEVVGDERTDKTTFQVRASWFNIQADRFEWKLDTSADGVTWTPFMSAVYTRGISGQTTTE